VEGGFFDNKMDTSMILHCNPHHRMDLEWFYMFLNKELVHSSQWELLGFGEKGSRDIPVELLNFALPVWMKAKRSMINELHLVLH